MNLSSDAIKTSIWSPGLATKWEAVTPTVWRFSLRTGVKFADGRPFTAEDAKFSLERANPPGGGMYAQFLATVDSVKVVDDATIEIVTKTPDPLLPRWLASIAIMSKSWSTEHGSTEVTPLAATKDQYVVRNTNGTGPFTRRQLGCKQRRGDAQAKPRLVGQEWTRASRKPCTRPSVRRRRGSRRFCRATSIW